MNNPGLTERLARVSARFRWITIALWVALIVAGGYAALGIGDVLTGRFEQSDKPESERANVLLEERLRGPQPAQEIVIVTSDGSADAIALEAKTGEVLAELRGLPDTVAFATSYYESGNKSLVSEDRQTALIPVVMVVEADDAQDNVGPIIDLAEEQTGGAFSVYTAGNGSIQDTFNVESEEGLRRGEMIALPIALLVLIVVFGAVVAAGLPLLMAIAAIVIAVGITALVGEVYELNFLVVNMITMIGLAVGIDYTLFIVHRYREERESGLPKEEAIARAGATSSRAVLFSGGAVVVGVLGLLIVPSNVYRSLSLGAAVVASIAVLAALTLLPAVLSVLGDKVNALRLPFGRPTTDHSGGGFWARVASVVMAHPVVSLVLTVSLLVAAAVPFFTINVGLAGVETLPEGTNSREAFEILDREFSAGIISPTEIVIDAPDVNSVDVQEAVARLQIELSMDEQFGEIVGQETNDAGDLMLISVLLQGDPDSDESHDAIDRLRDEHIPVAFAGSDANVLVTGSTAEVSDMFATIREYTPYVFALVLGLSFILLLMVFRSIVVPVKALIMNLLSVGAAYGLVVLVFQYGFGNELLGFQKTGTIEAWLPLFLFAFLFGLSMDYHVFLLSRIRERWDETHDNTDSVAYGISSTAGLITGAALIMVVVFSGFAMADVPPLQQSGFGLAVAVFLDATVIRIVLVPASMQLLGDWNWYLPSWLRWLPSLTVEGPANYEPQPSEADQRVASLGAPR
jgi:RND superfamily putative drug exporter